MLLSIGALDLLLPMSKHIAERVMKGQVMPCGIGAGEAWLSWQSRLQACGSCHSKKNASLLLVKTKVGV